MLVSDLSKDAAILQNIISTLAQIKPSGRVNVPLVIDYAVNCTEGLEFIGIDELSTIVLDELNGILLSENPDCTVSFYIDEERTSLLFSENTNAHPSSFSIANGKTRYTPPDSKLNDAEGISTTKAQPIYWVTATFCDGTVKKLAYRNLDNLLFQQVGVTSKPDPKFATNDNGVYILPKGQKIEIRQNNAPIDYIILDYTMYLQLNVFNWGKLSEAQRAVESYRYNNLLRNALYSDTSRGGYCTFFSKDLDETYVGDIDLRASDAILKGTVKMQCCYMADAQSSTEF